MNRCSKAPLSKIPVGNDFKIYIKVTKPEYSTEETVWIPMDLTLCKNISVQLLNEPRNIYIPLEWVLDDEDNSKIIADVSGISLTSGSTYGMQVTGIDEDGNNFRWKARGKEMFAAVDATNEARLDYDLLDYLDVDVRIGFEGAMGQQGSQGERGAVGPQGEKGDAFKYEDFTPEQLAALKGDQGSVGSQGSAGVQGSIGVQGEKGDTGAVGPQGEKGDTGAVGPQGEKGEIGYQGSIGPQGEKGDTGAVGPQGERGEGQSYTDTIIVGQGLITDDIKPTAKFGFFNNTTNSVFSVGKGSVASTYSTGTNFTPLNERGKTFTYVGNYDIESYIGANDQAFFINLTPNNTNKGYDDNDTEFTLNYNYYWPYIAANFENHILKRTIKYRESAHPERNFDIDFTIEVDPSIPTTTFTLKTTRDIKLIQTPTLNRGNVTRKDALSVDSDGYVNILSAPGGSGSTTYRLQDKFSNIETSINNINNTVSSLPTPEIISQTDYDNYLYHDPNKMYVTIEEDLTDYKNEYFTITPLGLNNPIVLGSFRLSIDASNFSIEYSKDKITWTPYTSGSWYGFTDLEPVYLRGTGSAYSSSTKFGQFSFTLIQNVKISGNIMSLLYGDNFQNQTSLTEYNINFSQLFLRLTALTDASKLILPATSLTNLAYSQMFMNCSNLIYGPKELPATTLTRYCYSGMFENCSKLSHPISLLPSTNGASYCYRGMYKNCISLDKSPSIRLTNGHSDFINLYLTDEMFYGCTSLKYVEIMANHTLANQGLGSNFLYNVPNDLNSIFVMNRNSKFFTGIPDKWQIVKVTPPTNS